MQVTVLGTGAAMPDGHRMQSGYLIDGGSGPLLIDCGSGILHRLAQTTIGYAGVESLLLTHHHLDHLADLLPLLKARWLADAPTLHVYGPSGTESIIEELLTVHDYLDEKVAVAATDIQTGMTEIDDWMVRAHPTKHSMAGFAYRFPGASGDLTISGDSEAISSLANFADGSRVLIHDCSFPDSVSVSNHPTPTSLGRTYSKSDIDRIILTHLYPLTSEHHSEMCQTVADYTNSSVDILNDLDEFTV